MPILGPQSYSTGNPAVWGECTAPELITTAMIRANTPIRWPANQSGPQIRAELNRLKNCSQLRAAYILHLHPYLISVAAMLDLDELVPLVSTPDIPIFVLWRLTGVFPDGSVSNDDMIKAIGGSNVDAFMTRLIAQGKIQFVPERVTLNVVARDGTDWEAAAQKMSADIVMETTGECDETGQWHPYYRPTSNGVYSPDVQPVQVERVETVNGKSVVVFRVEYRPAGGGSAKDDLLDRLTQFPVYKRQLPRPEFMVVPGSALIEWQHVGGIIGKRGGKWKSMVSECGIKPGVVFLSLADMESGLHAFYSNEQLSEEQVKQLNARVLASSAAHHLCK